MIQHPRNAFHDCQAEAKAAIRRAVIRIESTKLFEYFGAFFFRNPRSRVPNFDSQCLAAASTADEDTSASRISHCIRKKVLQHPPQ